MNGYAFHFRLESGDHIILYKTASVHFRLLFGDHIIIGPSLKCGLMNSATKESPISKTVAGNVLLGSDVFCVEAPDFMANS